MKIQQDFFTFTGVWSSFAPPSDPSPFPTYSSACGENSVAVRPGNLQTAILCLDSSSENLYIYGGLQNTYNGSTSKYPSPSHFLSLRTFYGIYKALIMECKVISPLPPFFIFCYNILSLWKFDLQISHIYLSLLNAQLGIFLFLMLFFTSFLFYFFHLTHVISATHSEAWKFNLQNATYTYVGVLNDTAGYLRNLRLAWLVNNTLYTLGGGKQFFQ